jgi:hypothetical protein
MIMSNNSRLYVGNYLPILLPDPKKYFVYQCGMDWCLLIITLDKKRYFVAGIFTNEDDAILFKKAHKKRAKKLGLK